MRNLTRKMQVRGSLYLEFVKKKKKLNPTITKKNSNYEKKKQQYHNCTILRAPMKTNKYDKVNIDRGRKKKS
jgi:hypothetical protein